MCCCLTQAWLESARLLTAAVSDTFGSTFSPLSEPVAVAVWGSLPALVPLRIRNGNFASFQRLANPYPGCQTVMHMDASMTMTPSSTMNSTSLFASFPEKPSLSSTDRKTVRTNRQAVEKKIASRTSVPAWDVTKETPYSIETA